MFIWFLRRLVSPPDPGQGGDACFDARWRRVHDRAPLVDDSSTGGCQGVPVRQAVVAARQQIDGVRTRRSGWQQHRDHRLGRAAAIAVIQSAGKAVRRGTGPAPSRPDGAWPRADDEQRHPRAGTACCCRAGRCRPGRWHTAACTRWLRTGRSRPPRPAWQALAPSPATPDPVRRSAHRGEQAATVTAAQPGNPRSKALPYGPLPPGPDLGPAHGTADVHPPQRNNSGIPGSLPSSAGPGRGLRSVHGVPRRHGARPHRGSRGCRTCTAPTAPRCPPR